MAIFYIEGFDDLSITDLAPAGYVSTATSGVSMVAGRFGGQAIRMSSINSRDTLAGLPLPSQPITTGFAWKHIGVSTAPLIASIQSTVDADQPVLAVCYDSNNQRLQLGSGGSSFGAFASGTVGSVVIPVGSYVYIELSYDPGADAAAVRVNGDVVLVVGSGANPNSREMSGVALGPSVNASTSTGEWDDWYVAEGYLAWQGEQRIITRFPTSDTARNDLTPSSGEINYLMVDEPTPDGDVTYNEGTTAGETDRYASSTGTSNPLTVPAVAIRSFVRKTDVETKRARNVLRVGSATANGNTEVLSTTYMGYLSTYSLNPDTGLPWTGTAAEAAEFGIEIIE